MKTEERDAKPYFRAQNGMGSKELVVYKNLKTKKGAIDYESEAIEMYQMISEEFDYEQIRTQSEMYSIK